MTENYSEEIRENDRRISERMQEGFDISSDSYSIRKLINSIDDGKIHDAPYQRGEVWDIGRKRALIESILKYGGKKVPALVLRRLNDGTSEIVDGKQRLFSSIKSFEEGKFSLNGISTPEFTGYKLKDIEKYYPLTYSAFMSTQIPVLILSNMSDEEAIIYFHQVNSSGIKMSCGERIHAMQDTPILKCIEDLNDHDVWGGVTHIGRYNDYEYISKMLLFVRDSSPSEGIFRGDDKDKNKLLRELEDYISTEVPYYMFEGVEECLDFLNKIFTKYNFKLGIREFYNVFTYVQGNIDSLSVSDFGKFIEQLYYFIHETDEITQMNAFTVIKTKHQFKGFNYNAEYYRWYSQQIDVMYSRFLEGEDWDEIKEEIL